MYISVHGYYCARRRGGGGGGWEKCITYYPIKLQNFAFIYFARFLKYMYL